MIIVVIDSGLDKEYKSEYVKGGISVIDNGKLSINDDYSDEIGHGTAVVDVLVKSIVEKRIGNDISIYVVKIFEKNIFIEIDVLCVALKYIEKNMKPDIVQISAGGLLDNEKLESIVEQITVRCLIVAAFDNKGAKSYPASYKKVIGVDVDAGLKRNQLVCEKANHTINYTGCEKFYRVQWCDNKKNLVKGTSFLTSEVTAKLILEHKVNSYRRYLNRNSHKLKEDINISDFVKEIQNAIVFPFNKEIHSLAKFEIEMNFSVQGYYDIKQKYLVGKKISEKFPHINNSSIIFDYNTIPWNEGAFDTIICGHLGRLSEVMNHDYLNEIINKCIKYEKRAFFLMKYLKEFLKKDLELSL